MRLGKYLAHAGLASRRAAERIVAEGRVTVAGQAVLDPARDVDEHSRVEVDGRVVRGREERVAYALNKPLGVLSTAHDPFDRPTVLALVPNERLRLYPVGRLDADSTGLILLTNDGELAHRLTHPRFEVPKTYLATVAGGPVGEAALRRLREGVALEDGVTAPAHVRRVRSGSRAARPVESDMRIAPSDMRPVRSDTRARGEVLEITIHEGRNRQVRRMCEAVGHPVMKLQRIAFGPLKLSDLRPGAYRQLSDAELRALRRLAHSQTAARNRAARRRGEPRPRSGGGL